MVDTWAVYAHGLDVPLKVGDPSHTPCKATRSGAMLCFGLEAMKKNGQFWGVYFFLFDQGIAKEIN